ncbi:hypothetical protein SDC9_88251 [bioreactor metagenome]|uniref:Uncharacterized protein n=1 Tax=bioreactor metagenome TaxID=1076179 RepID=A0A644ZLD4_9ZZZZ
MGQDESGPFVEYKKLAIGGGIFTMEPRLKALIKGVQSLVTSLIRLMARAICEIAEIHVFVIAEEQRGIWKVSRYFAHE